MEYRKLPHGDGQISINPAYDYRHGEYAIGSGDERSALYRRAKRKVWAFR